MGANRAGQVQCGLATATAYVQNSFARMRTKRGQTALAKRSKLSFQRLTDFGPSGEPYFVLSKRK
ncbi:MAG TPA: hypothetical protein VKT76_08730 [Bradyrhizobium sp.]|nr:hypothetical protein [Bradyrhizobium sp.]